METETENKKHQWTNSISSSASSSRSSSITSDSSDGHFDIRHFPLPKPSLSASEAQKQRESYQAYSSGSSWSSTHKNHLIDLPGYDPNRIPNSVFSSKPANSADWSIASNESLFSIHNGSFSISSRDDHVLAATLRLAEMPRLEETVHEITEINPVPLPPLPPIKKPNETEKETNAEEEELYQVEISDSEIDDNEEKEQGVNELESDKEQGREEEEEEEEEEEIKEAGVLVETESENPEEIHIVENVKEKKSEDSNSIVSHSASISCRSDTSNNSIGSFAFPLLQKEDEIVKTPSMQVKGNVSNKQRPEYQPPQSPMLQPQPYAESQSESQRKESKRFETHMHSPKPLKSGWFSCFHCPSKCGLFK